MGFLFFSRRNRAEEAYGLAEEAMARIDEVFAALAVLQTENAETISGVQAALGRIQVATDALAVEVQALKDALATAEPLTAEQLQAVQDKVTELKGEQDQLQSFLDTVAPEEPPVA